MSYLSPIKIKNIAPTTPQTLPVHYRLDTKVSARSRNQFLLRQQIWNGKERVKFTSNLVQCAINQSSETFDFP